MMAVRKIIGWIIIGISAWFMSKWVYKNTNENYCREKGRVWSAEADTCTAVPLAK